MRMLAALVASLIFTFIYATPAAKSRRAETVLIPLLDVLQSVPVLGYLSFTVVFFVSLFPGSSLGPELAAIFAIFTAQAWNMAFSFYQSLITVPTDLDEASRSFRFSGWHLPHRSFPNREVCPRSRDLAEPADDSRDAMVHPLATVIWVPVGVGVGLRPKLAEKVQPIAQFLAAFPVMSLRKLVIAGASAFPSDFREAASSFRIHGWRWWRQVMLPGIFPYYVTGLLPLRAALGTRCIVSEAVSWGPTKLSGSGLGAYIARMTEAGDYPRIALGVAVMSVFVITMNRLLWRPLYSFAQRRTRLD